MGCAGPWRRFAPSRSAVGPAAQRGDGLQHHVVGAGKAVIVVHCDEPHLVLPREAAAQLDGDVLVTETVLCPTTIGGLA